MKKLTFATLSAIAFLIVISFLMAPQVKDVIQENYICVHGEYQNNHFDDFCFTTDDGERIKVRRPIKFGIPIFDYDKFPEGTYVGTAWYAGNSWRMLIFTPDEPYPWDK